MNPFDFTCFDFTQHLSKHPERSRRAGFILSDQRESKDENSPDPRKC
jgi:hypothetical protein